jgi:hypothetical protein
MDSNPGLSWYQIVSGLTALVALAYGWIFTRVLSDQKELEKRLAEHVRDTSKKLDELPDRYVRRDDFADFKSEVLQVLNRIEAKLDGKADKP